MNLPVAGVFFLRVRAVARDVAWLTADVALAYIRVTLLGAIASNVAGLVAPVARLGVLLWAIPLDMPWLATVVTCS